MSNPVQLPSSKMIVDFNTIKNHLQNYNNDPFDRSPLNLNDVIFLNNLKEEITKWKLNLHP